MQGLQTGDSPATKATPPSETQATSHATAETSEEQPVAQGSTNSDRDAHQQRATIVMQDSPRSPSEGDAGSEEQKGDAGALSPTSLSVPGRKQPVTPDIP